MPAYGILPATEGSGLLPWAWAVDRLTLSHDYWLATVWPDGRPHVMPVWGVWAEDALWFSSAKDSRKARNLARNPKAVMTTDNPLEPVVVEGVVKVVAEHQKIAQFAEWVDGKYQTNYGVAFFDSAANGCFRLSPSWAFALREGDFTGSPTRWTFAQ
jgi:PPOX class probable F420-dependent enzyme